MNQIRWENNRLLLLDQRRLPAEVSYLDCGGYQEVIEAIKTLAVRGAPLIGVAAAMALVLASRNIGESDFEAYRGRLLESEREIRNSRPTAVNLMWALDRMLKALEQQTSAEEIRQALEEEALALWREDIELCRRMGQLGSELIPDGAGVLTHCNTGSLATAGSGTALSVIRTAWKQGKKIHVYVDETRPLLQGARLTAWELANDGIPFTLITDNMAGHIMKQGKIGLAITGADRIAANGDSANKIGTYSVAVLAKYHGIPFYITAPYSTVDMTLENGGGIVIEERSGEEVRNLNGCGAAPSGCAVCNPAFDVTPGELISAIVTDRGIIRPPFPENMKKMMA